MLIITAFIWNTIWHSGTFLHTTHFKNLLLKIVELQTLKYGQTLHFNLCLSVYK